LNLNPKHVGYGLGWILGFVSKYGLYKMKVFLTNTWMHIFSFSTQSACQKNKTQ